MTELNESAEPAPESAQKAETVLYAWEARVRVLTNPSAWFGVSVSLGGGALALGILFLFISRSVMGFLVSGGIFCGLMILFVLIGGIIDLFGGFRVTFVLTNRGVRSMGGAGAKSAANAAIVGGMLTGNITGIGAGALARSEQNVFIPWGEISRAKVSERRRYILVKGVWGQKPIGLVCNTDNFSQVLQILRERSTVSEKFRLG